MTSLGRFILFILLIVPLSAVASSSGEPIPFILEKAQENDVILFGTTHKRDDILDFLAELLPRLPANGITHIGFEIDSDQQGAIENYIATGNGLDAIQVLPTIDCPKYRRLIQIMRGTSLKPIAIDLPASKWHTPDTRDEWMARSITEAMDGYENSKVFVVVGGIHTLKRVEWLVNKDHGAIRPYLKQMRPDLKVYTIYSCIGCDNDEGTFRNIAVVDAGGFILETRGLDLPFHRLNDMLNAKPLAVQDAVDAVLVYD